jgi:tRNA(Ile)-lysidine synthase
MASWPDRPTECPSGQDHLDQRQGHGRWALNSLFAIVAYAMEACCCLNPSEETVPPAPENPLLTRVREFLARLEIREAQVLVSVSGGPDSTALLRLLCRLRDEFQLTLHVAHFNHGLRPESAAESNSVVDLGRSLGVEVHVESLPVTDGADPRTAVGIEERSRMLRYHALEAIAARHGCPFVAVGHTLDDQVETVLQRLMRGTGLWGLAGMRESRPIGSATLVRPLLYVRRTDIESWLKSIGQPWCEDASNRDPRFTRNRIRHELLPELRTLFNPQADRHIADLADHIREVMAFIENRATQLLKAALLESQSAVQKWDTAMLNIADPFLRCEALRLAWREGGWSEQGMTRVHWRSLATLCEAPPPASLSLPDSITASRRAKLLVIERSV